MINIDCGFYFFQVYAKDGRGCFYLLSIEIPNRVRHLFGIEWSRGEIETVDFLFMRFHYRSGE